jgi:acyl-CoA thioester hydrolase
MNSTIRSRAPRPTPRAFIADTSTLLVRFNEVDALHIVWHGHYVNYFEEGRRAFGRRHGCDYPAFIAQRVAVPVIHLEIYFRAPAKLSDSARLDFDYEIRRAADATLLATGSTSQVFTTPDGELLLNWPPFMLERLKSWEPLWKNP